MSRRPYGLVQAEVADSRFCARKRLGRVLGSSRLCERRLGLAWRNNRPFGWRRELERILGGRLFQVGFDNLFAFVAFPQEVLIPLVPRFERARQAGLYVAEEVDGLGILALARVAGSGGVLPWAWSPIRAILASWVDFQPSFSLVASEYRA
jgi:hypothetical protein